MIDLQSGGRNVFVLSGGGSRGAAQLGMLRSLLSAGITPDHLVGASVGALNATFVATDPTVPGVERLIRLWGTMRSRSITGPPAKVLVNLLGRRPYLYTSDTLRALITHWVGDCRLESLSVPVRIATTDLHSGMPVHHDRGRLVDVLAASTALPAVFPPVTLPGERGVATEQVDAGVSENVPISGACGLTRPGDTVWVLDVTKAWEPRRMRNPIDVLVAALSGTMLRQSHTPMPDGVTVRHLKLDERFDCGSVFDFRHTGTLIRMGEREVAHCLAGEPTDQSLRQPEPHAA